MSPSERVVLGSSLVGAAMVGYALHRWGGIDFAALVAGLRGRKVGGRFGRDASGLPASIWFVCAAAVFLSIVLGGSLAIMLPPGLVGSRGSAAASVAGGACGFGLGSLVALLLLYLIRPRAGTAAGTALRWSDAPIGLLAAACIAPFYIAAAMGAQWLVRDVLGQPLPQLAHTSLETFVKGPLTPIGLTIAFTAGVLAPIAEECIYRVFLTSCLLRLLGGMGDGRRTGAADPRRVALAILITSALFAAQHAAGGGPVPWAAVPGLFVLSLGMGIAYERTRRLGVPIVAHGAFNLVNLALAAAGVRGE